MILTEQHETIFEIVLARPEKRNALNLSMMDQLAQTIDRAEAAKGVRVVIIRGEGKGFSSGIDLFGFGEIAERFGEDWTKNLFPVTAHLQAVVNKVENCTYPVIALLHGFCLGMAFELALACDFRIAAHGTRLGLPETTLGIIPDVGGTTRLVRLVGAARAKELILTGRVFETEYAEQWGIINRAVIEDNLLQVGHDLANELSLAAPLAVSYGKRVINGITDIERGLHLEAWAQSVLMQTQDFQNAVQAMMTKEPVKWEGR